MSSKKKKAVKILDLMDNCSKDSETFTFRSNQSYREIFMEFLANQNVLMYVTVIGLIGLFLLTV